VSGLTQNIARKLVSSSFGRSHKNKNMAVHESKNESHVAKLSDSNYRIWKTEMKWYLRSKGLLEYALGTITVSAESHRR